MRKLILFLVISFVALGVAIFWYSFDFLFVPPGNLNQKIIFEVPHGASFNKVASELENAGVVKDHFKFKVLARISGYMEKVRRGEYELNKGMKPLEILDILASGKSIQYKVTFQEGINIYEIAEILEAKGFYKKEEFLGLAKDPKFAEELLGEPLESLEGYLFPETYNLTKFTPAKALIRLMVENFNKNFEEISLESKVNFKKHEIVILASIIEKETGAPEERPLISSVFHNRLSKKMRLQSDPTILYGILDISGEMKKNIKKKDITAHTKYNTYTVKALPYGPIANPGKHSLHAAVAPESSEYLFFVSKNDGTHKFTETYKAHQAAVKKFQLDAKEREGKSWRDLNKNKASASN